MDEKIEEIAIEEEAEEIEKLYIVAAQRFQFPVATISIGKSACITFNKASCDIIPEYIQWSTTATYVIGLPTTASDKNGFKTRHIARRPNQRGYVQAHLPVVLVKEKKIQAGYYRLYKYKDGFAFKRYERMEIENNG